MPRFPPVIKTTAISGCQVGLALSQTSGWPSWNSALAVGRQPADDLSGERRPHLGDPRRHDPMSSPTVDGGGGWSVPPSVPEEQEPGSGGLQRGFRAEDAARGAHHHPFGHVEVLALVQGGLCPPRPGGTDLVHQRVEVLGLGDGQGLDLGQAALGPSPLKHAHRGRAPPARCRPEAGERLERLAPTDRAAELRGEQAGPFRRVVVDVGVHIGHDAHFRREERQ